MPYRITQESDFLRLSYEGDVTNEEVRRAGGEVDAIVAKTGRMPNRLVDTSALQNSAIKAEDVRNTAERLKAQRYPNRFRVAIFAPQGAQFGFARLFQTVSDHPDMEIRVFSAEAEAIDWLRAGQ